MSFVRTVLGDIPPAGLGVTYAHEHLIIERSFTTDRFPEFLLDDLGRAIDEVNRFRRAGGCSLVDAMPCDSGRNPGQLAELSRRTGAHIVASTGLHLPMYYDSGHWSRHYDETTLAGLFIADIEEGIDAGDYGGPVVRRTPHRAGVIKIATGAAFTLREERIFAAAAEAHRRTGCPILTHTEQGTLGLEQATRLIDAGVAPGKIVLSHLDRRPDPAYHREVLATGVCLEYDSAFRWSAERGNPTCDLLTVLFPEHPRQLLLGMDMARRSYWRSHGGGPGLDFLLTAFRTTLEAAGLGQTPFHTLMIENPAEAYSFAPAA
ncbi:MAG: aryldialkylphosphatase [Puniceicoccaceae bacterium]|nr:MAG: aryldialkylphosphatase [Puniceicoccaceae bacterium]